MAETASVTPHLARAAFPALDSPLVFLENAGGSQVPRVVADAVHGYMLESYVQLGAGYLLSEAATEMVSDAHAWAGVLGNVGDGVTILGPSTTALCRMLAGCYREAGLGAGQSVVLAESGHEANLGPWVEFEKAGVEIRWWRVDSFTAESSLDDLRELLDESTAIVAIPHVSNLLGEIVDVAEVARAAHHVGARVVVDGVAYAPHRAIDVSGWDVDWYVYSTYKTYGPHMAVLFGKRDAVRELRGPNHFFIPREDVPYKFEPGGVSHEGCAGLLALAPYLGFLAGQTSGEPVTRDTVEAAFAQMTTWELPLQARLVDWLMDRDTVRVIGPDHGEASRVATVSFVHETRSSAEIVAALHAANIAVRHGHMYAYRLCEAMGLDPGDGVVRISAVHYNTIEEIERVIEVLEPLV
jgi:cysteine desulfurase family protein (TIGR01976 family)